MTRTINVALIGQKFMGRAHSNAWAQGHRSSSTCRWAPVMHTVSARDGADARSVRCTLGVGADHDRLAARSRATPGAARRHRHTQPRARGAGARDAEAGKHVACEKPLRARSRTRVACATRPAGAAGETFVWFNYRRVRQCSGPRLVEPAGVGRISTSVRRTSRAGAGPRHRSLWLSRPAGGLGAHSATSVRTSSTWPVS